MNRADRRAAQKQCRREGHLWKSGSDGPLPHCVRCGEPREGRGFA